MVNPLGQKPTAIVPKPLKFSLLKKVELHRAQQPIALLCGRNLFFHTLAISKMKDGKIMCLMEP